MADDAQYLVKVGDDAGKYKAILALDPPQVEGSAADFIFNYVGNPNTAELVQRQVLGEQYVPQLEGLKGVVFDKDDQGLLIRDGIDFRANGQPLNPDLPFKQYFQAKEGGGQRYYLADVVVTTPELIFDELKTQEMRAYQAMYTLHRIYKGHKVDVTRDDAFLSDIIKDLEEKGFLEVDTTTAGWKLSARGREAHQEMIEEARELIRRYDIFNDVDFDRDGTPLFGSGSGDDMRIPVYDFKGINPFRARFVIGINDGEFDKVPDWPERITTPEYFDEIFAPIEQAPAIDDIGRAKLEAIVREGNAQMRERKAEAEYRGGRDEPRERYEVEVYEVYNDPYFDRSRWWGRW